MARGYSDSCVVTMVSGVRQTERPHLRPYLEVETIATALAAGYTLADIMYDSKLGKIRLSLEMSYDPHVRMHHVSGTDHMDMIWEARKTWAAVAPTHEDTVLDLGAHVGGFSVWAARECGARSVVAVEAAPDTVEILRLNLADLPNARIVHAACVGAEDVREINLWLTKNHTNNGSCMASVIRATGRSAVVVPAVAFSSLMRELVPTVLKVDVEGEELSYPLTDRELMASVRVLALELHLRSDKTRARCAELVADLEQDFDLLTGEKVLLRRPLNFGSFWAVNGVWRRRTGR